MSGLITTASLVLDATGVNQLLGNPFIWQWWALGGWLVFIFFMSWILYGLHSQINQTKVARPRITVTPKVYYSDKAKLEIHNNGPAAVFSATARIIKGYLEPNLLNLYWESCPSDITCRINKRDTRSILVAEISPNTEQTDDPRTAVFKDGIALYQVGGRRIGAGDYQSVQNGKLKERYPTMFENAPELVDECEIEVTITSDPELSLPFDRQRYLIKIDHEHNGKLVFNSVPNPDKEGSPSK